MKLISILWNPKTDATAVNFTPDYKDLHSVAKIDVLQNAISILQDECMEKIEELRARDKVDKVQDAIMTMQKLTTENIKELR